MIRQTVPTPAPGALTRGASSIAGTGAAGRAAAGTSTASTAPPGPEPRSPPMSTPRSAASRRALGDAAASRAPVPSRAAPFWLSTNASTSAFSMRPLAVRTRVRSTPCCSASLRASGDAFTPAADAPPTTGAAGTAPVAAALAAGMTGTAPAALPASPAAKTTAIVRPTGTTSPSRAVTSRSTPEAGASSSTVTLSVSISTTGSPFWTGSPGRLSQWMILPVSCASSSAGMMMLVGIRSSALEDFPRGGQRPLGSRGVDVQVRDRANQARARRAHAHAPSGQPLDGHRRGQLAGQLEEDDVGLDRRRIEADAGQAGQALGEPPSVGVILGQALHVMAKRVHATGSDDAGLAHRAAHLLLAPPRLVDELARAGERGADRRAEPLGEVDPHRIEGRGVVARRDPAGDDRVHQARAVHVGGQAMTARHRGHRLDAGHRPDRAATVVAGLLHPEQPGPRGVPGTRADRRLHRAHVELAARAVDRAHVDAGEGGGPAGLGVDRVSAAVGDHLFAVPRVHAERDLVAHGARGHEHGGFLAQEIGHHLAKLVDRRILELLLVAHLGLAHEPAHVGRGLADGVAVEIDVDTRGIGHGRHAFRHRAFAAWNDGFSEGTVRSLSRGGSGND